MLKSIFIFRTLIPKLLSIFLRIKKCFNTCNNRPFASLWHFFGRQGRLQIDNIEIFKIYHHQSSIALVALVRIYGDLRVSTDISSWIFTEDMGEEGARGPPPLQSL